MTELAAGLMVTSNVRLVRPFGAGGMGTVWIAEHLGLSIDVVVKFISAQLASDPQARERFKREAAAASQVKSPHVVQMLDHGITEDGHPFIVMELLEGHDLERHMRAHGRLSVVEVVHILAQVGKALSKAHERGIVHRDIKPDNIFLCDVGGDDVFVKLLDFGIARASQSAERLTSSGAVVGTLHYMAPEQVIGKGDHRADLWSLAVVAFEAITGTRLFDGDTVGAVTLAIHMAEIPSPSSVIPELPPSLDAWFVRALARDPEARFASAKEMVDALVAATEGVDPAVRHAGTSVRPPRVASAPELAKTVLATPAPRERPQTTGSLASVRDPTPPIVAPPGRRWVVALALLVAAGAGAALVMVLARGQSSPPTTASSGSSSSQGSNVSLSPSSSATLPAVHTAADAETTAIEPATTSIASSTLKPPTGTPSGKATSTTPTSTVTSTPARKDAGRAIE